MYLCVDGRCEYQYFSGGIKRGSWGDMECRKIKYGYGIRRL